MPAMLKRRYCDFSGPSGPNTTHDATVASPIVWLMSKHSMRCGVSSSSSRSRKASKRAQQRLPAGQTRGQRRLGIAPGQIEESRAIAAHAGLDLDRVPLCSVSSLGEQLAILGRMAHDQLARHRPLEVILRDERAEHRRLVRIDRQARKEIARAQADAVAEEQHA